MENIYFGTAYYPEHWPEDRWETDAELMKEMGIDVIRMGEFSWHKMEPLEGCYDFGWLDGVIELFAGYGIKTVLGTPTAAPPAWLIRKYPEILPVDRDGIRREFGGRHHDCQSNPVYRKYVKAIVREIAEHFKENPYVIGFQIDNELGNSHEDLCMCDSCADAFRQWLEKKYGDICALNLAWGNQFWSQEYNDFKEIGTPKKTVTGENPSRMLDWRRFCSDLVVDFAETQADILRQICPGKFITHNFMGFSDKVDYFKLAETLDFAGQDQYHCQFFAEDEEEDIAVPAAKAAAALDLIRGTKQRNFWILEQQSGPAGWECMGRAIRPGRLSNWTMHSIAHGADTIVYFRWRVSPVGTEQYWHGILPHSGNPGSRYEELKRFIRKTRPLMQEIRGCMPEAKAAVLFSYDEEYALKIQPNNRELSYIGQVNTYYRSLFRKNIPVDFVQEQAEWKKYKLLIAPLLYLMHPGLEQKLKEYAENGGNLVLTMRTGVKDWNNVCMTEKELPGNLQELTGIQVKDYDCLNGLEVLVDWNGENYKTRKWADLMEVLPENRQTVKVLAQYASQFYQGLPAVTVNCYEKGKVWYVGSEPTDELLDCIMDNILAEAGITGLANTPEGVEAVSRKGKNKDYIFLLNHRSSPGEVEIPKQWQSYFGEQDRFEVMSGGKRILTLEGYQTAVYVKEVENND